MHGVAIISQNKNKNKFGIIKEFFLTVFSKAGSDNLPRLASSFSFFALLSVAPFLVLAVTIAALFLDKGETSKHLLDQAAEVGGPQVREYLRGIIESSQHRASGVIAVGLSLVVTFYSASNLFLNLDEAINFIWKRPGERSFVRNFIVTRVVAFLSVLIFGGVLVGWLILDQALAFAAKQSTGFQLWPLVSFLATVTFFTLGFSLTLQAFPRGELRWKDAIPGGFITALCFGISKYLLSYYFYRTSGVYSAAGGIVVLLLWMYYSSMIYFFGVEVTYAYAHEFGSRRNKKALIIPDQSFS